MKRNSFSAYLNDLQRERLRVLADVEMVTSSAFLGSRIDNAWNETFGANVHPSQVKPGGGLSKPTKTILAAGGRKRRVSA